ncbi:hypothetical protein ABS767_07505 [Sphingomonas sp. ST-64]|uniref:Uncharacterized protein n=1 Tax=Sphingomonas plantiphila TaxID=3163295 RepID=A0ABW8YKI8_9SPHN
MHAGSHRAFSQIERGVIFGKAANKRPVILPKNASILQRPPQWNRFADCLLIIAKAIPAIARET